LLAFYKACGINVKSPYLLWKSDLRLPSVMKERSLTSFKFTLVGLGLCFIISSWFWVSIKVIMCATCVMHILCFTLHLLRTWKSLMIFFKAIDSVLVVDFGFYVVSSLHFSVWFLDFCIIWFQFVWVSYTCISFLS